ncbi:PilW family protein [Chromobacterium alticapitis]|uniref:PilW family protein n=1 Tax=Chromobacterium alticapitis TaxID=2073169 RepID=UPI0011B0D4AE|nr:PilW family protein [Chromobacterium alticapitis]
MSRLRRSSGFSLVELMVAITIGLLLLTSLVGIMVVGRKDYSVDSAQGELQSAGSTAANLIAQSARQAGFFGCSGSSTSYQLAAANGVLGNFTSPVTGYDAVLASSTLTLNSLNPANDNSLADWSPSLDASLQGRVEKGSDVMIFSGQTNGSAPLWVNAYASAGATSLPTQSTSGVATKNLLSVSNCGHSSIMQVSGVNGASGAITLSQALDSDFPPGSVAAPLAQTAYFVAQATGAQSALYQATYDGTTAGWQLAPIVPGVDALQVWYGIGSTPGVTTEYVPASQVANWSQVNSLRIGMLLEGAQGSAPALAGIGNGCGNPTSWTVLGATVVVPCDTRLRHVYTMTVSLRNAGL